MPVEILFRRGKHSTHVYTVMNCIPFKILKRVTRNCDRLPMQYRRYKGIITLRNSRCNVHTVVAR